MKKCPVCSEGKLKIGKVKEELFGVFLGEYKAEICDKCGESFVDEETMLAIETKAKELGIWGLSKKVKVVHSGNSLAIRIPSSISKFLKLQEGIEISLHPEGRKC